MSEAVYDAVAFGMRYWFIAVIGIMLLLLIWISRSEYHERRLVMGEVGRYIGYVEVLSGAEDVIGERIGIMKENMIGSSGHADIVIDDKSVARSHAMINEKDGQMVLVPVGKGKTQINGRRATRPHAVVSGDILRFGNIEMQLYLKPPHSDDDEET